MSIRATAYPAKHIWVNTPMFRAQVRQAELLRKFPPRQPRTRRAIRVWVKEHIKDKPHILPCSGYDLRETWNCMKSWFLGYRPIDREIVSSGKSRPLFQ